MPLRTSMRFRMHGRETRLSSNRLVAQSGVELEAWEHLISLKSHLAPEDPRLQNFKQQFVWKDKKMLVIFHEVNLEHADVESIGPSSNYKP